MLLRFISFRSCCKFTIHGTYISSHPRPLYQLGSVFRLLRLVRCIQEYVVYNMLILLNWDELATSLQRREAGEWWWRCVVDGVRGCSDNIDINTMPPYPGNHFSLHSRRHAPVKFSESISFRCRQIFVVKCERGQLTRNPRFRIQ